MAKVVFAVFCVLSAGAFAVGLIMVLVGSEVAKAFGTWLIVVAPFAIWIGDRVYQRWQGSKIIEPPRRSLKRR